MSDDQFQGNPMVNKPGKQQKEMAPAPTLSGEVIIRKTPIGRKLKQIFFGGDFKGAARQTVAEVLIPDMRELIWDSFTGFAKKIVFPSGRDQARSRGPISTSSRTTYNMPIQRSAYSSAMLPGQPPHLSRHGRMQMEDIILPMKEDCEIVLDYLMDIIDKEKVATKADLMHILGRPWDYTAQMWGWGFLGNAEIVQLREGFLLDLPPMEPLQR